MYSWSGSCRPAGRGTLAAEPHKQMRIQKSHGMVWRNSIHTEKAICKFLVSVRLEESQVKNTHIGWKLSSICWNVFRIFAVSWAQRWCAYVGSNTVTHEPETVIRLRFCLQVCKGPVQSPAGDKISLQKRPSAITGIVVSSKGRRGCPRYVTSSALTSIMMPYAVKSNIGVRMYICIHTRACVQQYCN